MIVVKRNQYWLLVGNGKRWPCQSPTFDHPSEFQRCFSELKRFFILLATIRKIFQRNIWIKTLIRKSLQYLAWLNGLTQSLKWIIQQCNRQSWHFRMHFLWQYNYFIGSVRGSFHTAVSFLRVNESLLKLHYSHHEVQPTVMCLWSAAPYAWNGMRDVVVRQRPDEKGNTWICTSEGFAFFPVRHAYMHISTEDFEARSDTSGAATSSVSWPLQRSHCGDISPPFMQPPLGLRHQVTFWWPKLSLTDFCWMWLHSSLNKMCTFSIEQREIYFPTHQV